MGLVTWKQRTAMALRPEGRLAQHWCCRWLLNRLNWMTILQCTILYLHAVFVDMCDLFACMVCCDLLWKSDASNMLLRLHENIFPFFFHSFTINYCIVLTAKTWSGFAHVVLEQVLFINTGKVVFRLTARIQLSWGPHRPSYLHTLSALVIPLTLNLEWFA